MGNIEDEIKELPNRLQAPAREALDFLTNVAEEDAERWITLVAKGGIDHAAELVIAQESPQELLDGIARNAENLKTLNSVYDKRKQIASDVVKDLLLGAFALAKKEVI